jgi:hypothetical protein
VLLVFANKQDMKGALTAAQISEALNLTSLRDRQWHIQVNFFKLNYGNFLNFFSVELILNVGMLCANWRRVIIFFILIFCIILSINLNYF